MIREFSQAKKAARHGPVIITDRGKPAHVLLSIEEFRRLTGTQRSIVETLSMPGLSEIGFDPQRATIESLVADLF